MIYALYSAVSPDGLYRQYVSRFLNIRFRRITPKGPSDLPGDTTEPFRTAQAQKASHIHIQVTLVTHFKEDRIAKGRREFSPSLSKGIEWIF
jgi:hypothetical protein